MMNHVAQRQAICPPFFVQYPLLSDSRCCHHSSGHSVFGAMGEQDVGAASGAHRNFGDISGEDSGGEQLAAVGLSQIEKDLFRQLAVAGGA